MLEEEAGAILLRKEGRTLGLTRSGQVLVEHVRRVMGAVDEAMSAVAATNDRTSGQLVVGAFNTAISLLAVPLVQRLSSRLPDLHVQVQQQSSLAVRRLVRQGEVDLAIACTYDFRGQESLNGLSQQPLLDEPLVLLAPAHLHRRVHSQGLGALAGQPWVTNVAGSALDAAVQLIGERAGFQPKVKHRLGGAQNIVNLGDRRGGLGGRASVLGAAPAGAPHRRRRRRGLPHAQCPGARGPAAGPEDRRRRPRAGGDLEGGRGECQRFVQLVATG